MKAQRLYPTIVCSIALAIFFRRMLAYASKNPVTFVALGSFSFFGAIPVLAFAAFGVATLLASIVGAVVIEFFILAAGITGLAFVLFFVMCISLWVASAFGVIYFVYQATSTTLSKTKDFPFRLSPSGTWPCTVPNNIHDITTTTTEQEVKKSSDDIDMVC